MITNSVKVIEKANTCFPSWENFDWGVPGIDALHGLGSHIKGMVYYLGVNYY